MCVCLIGWTRTSPVVAEILYCTAGCPWAQTVSRQLYGQARPSTWIAQQKRSPLAFAKLLPFFLVQLLLLHLLDVRFWNIMLLYWSKHRPSHHSTGSIRTQVEFMDWPLRLWYELVTECTRTPCSNPSSIAIWVLQCALEWTCERDLFVGRKTCSTANYSCADIIYT